MRKLILNLDVPPDVMLAAEKVALVHYSELAEKYSEQRDEAIRLLQCKAEELTARDNFIERLNRQLSAAQKPLVDVLTRARPIAALNASSGLLELIDAALAKVTEGK